MNNVPVYVRVNGTEQTETFSLNPGVLSDSAAAQDAAIRAQYGITSDSTKFRKAVLLSATGDIETEISRAGTYNGTVYYSLHDYDDTGVALKDGEKIVLIYQTQYKVTTHVIGLDSDGNPTANPGGTVIVANEVYHTDNLRVQTVPDTANLYRLQSITYTSGNNAGTVDVSNNAGTLNSDNYDGDIVLTVTFKIPDTFKITNVTPSHADEYGETTTTRGHGALISNRYGPTSLSQVQAVLQDAQNYSGFYDFVLPEPYHKRDYDGILAAQAELYYHRRNGNAVSTPLNPLIEYYRSGNNYLKTEDVPPDPVRPRGTATFYLQSQSNTGASTGEAIFELNKLELNGTAVAIPQTVGATATTIVNGMAVTVLLESKDEVGSYFINGDGSYRRKDYTNDRYSAVA
ncbi:MAG TPA: hypothetical protein PLS28_04290, partial [Clostridiales bacterium]|nr:hypothetical protein [Clostridiales bacterium]